MPNFKPVTRVSHGGKRWRASTNYVHARKDSAIALTAMELPRAVMHFPLAFISRDAAYVPAAVFNLQSGSNLFVTSKGTWLAKYIPAAYRSYPFRLVWSKRGRPALYIDEESGLVTDDPQGEAFFDDTGLPAKAVQDVFALLNRIETSRKATAAACATLAKHELIQPWSITVKTDGGDKAVEGLYRIDEAAFSRLPPEALLEVRDAGALAIVYCQLLSMQHLQTLGQLAQAQAKTPQVLAAMQDIVQNGELEMEFLNNGGKLSFDGF